MRNEAGEELEVSGRECSCLSYSSFESFNVDHLIFLIFELLLNFLTIKFKLLFILIHLFLKIKI